MSVLATVDVHLLAENPSAAEGEYCDASRALCLEELLRLPHDDVDYPSTYVHAGQAPLQMGAEGELDEHVTEAQILARLLSPTLPVAPQKDEILTVSIDAGLPIVNARKDETEAYDAFVLDDQGVTCGIEVAKGNNRDRRSRNKINPKCPEETEQQHFFSTTPTIAREEQKFSSDSKYDEAQVAETRTTCMLMNVPRRYTSSKLIHTMDLEGFAGLYNFIYVPMNVRTHSAMGCAFVNLLDPHIAKRFLMAFNGFSRWSSTTSTNVCQAVWAKTFQGLHANVDHYRNSTVLMQSVPSEYKPRLFENATEIAFPLPIPKQRRNVNGRPRPRTTM
eukprot:TRINITY_DN4931_c2_g7_i1.p1 TRINITY_DN4931_c2_g7~~TRINITY_DN4931_c2_g7_i1.p1  ORF type:complete len:333 (+),score=47.06 TRINITY_DN4931_c2_g7_i1:142-1140(+)